MNATERVTLRSASGHPIDVVFFPETDYQQVYQAMSEFTANRDDTERDQIWLVQHPPVYTQGTACSQETFVPSDIPVVKTDRGGQITYHGPGQIVMYPLLRLKRFNIGVKALVNKLEQCVIDILERHHVEGARKDDAPGVYVDGAKIAALGLRIRHGCSYHGLSFNIEMDTSPFLNVDPCGYKGLRVTQLSALLEQDNHSQESDLEAVSKQLVGQFLELI